MRQCSYCGAVVSDAAYCTTCGQQSTPSGTVAPHPARGGPGDGARAGLPRGGRRSPVALVAGLVTAGVVAGGLAGAAAVLLRPPAERVAPAPGVPGAQAAADDQAAAALADTRRARANGVLRVTATTCQGSGVGSGFLVAPDLLVTAADVVAGAAAVAVTAPAGATSTAGGGSDDRSRGAVTPGAVVGLDRAAGLALVRLDRPRAEPVLDLAPGGLAPGAAVLAVSVGLDGGRALREGSVTTPARGSLLGIDVAVDDGAAGGPLLDRDGAVVGVLTGSAGGPGSGVGADVAGPLVRSWTRAAPAPPPPPCEDALGPQDDRLGGVLDTTPGALATSVATTFEAYFRGINTGDFAAAYALLGPSTRSRTSPSQFADGAVTSYDFEVAVRDVRPAADGRVTAWVTFTSLQAAEKGPDGQTCTRWSLDYTLIPVGDGLLIDAARGHAGGPAWTECS